MRLLTQLRSCREGAAMVEFALLAPVLFVMMFGIIEGSRLLWMQQTLDEVAYSTARCMSVDSACANTGAQRDYAVQRAGGYGIAVAGGDVTVRADATCRGYANSSEVTISVAFGSPVRGLIPGLPERLQAGSCYPELS